MRPFLSTLSSFIFAILVVPLMAGIFFAMAINLIVKGTLFDFALRMFPVGLLVTGIIFVAGWLFLKVSLMNWKAFISSPQEYWRHLSMEEGEKEA